MAVKTRETPETAYKRGLKEGERKSGSEKKSLVLELVDDLLGTVNLALDAAEKKRKEAQAAKAKDARELDVAAQDKYNIMMLQSGSAKQAANYMSTSYGRLARQYRDASESGDLASELDAISGIDSLHFAFGQIDTERGSLLIGEVYDEANELYTRVYGVSLPSNPQEPARQTVDA